LDTKIPHALVTKVGDPAEADFLKGEILSLAAEKPPNSAPQHRPDFFFASFIMEYFGARPSNASAEHIYKAPASDLT
jgi:hypothetical protein